MNRLVLHLVILMFHLTSFASDECNFKPEHITNKNYEEILDYANIVSKKACITSVIAELIKYPKIPQSDALHSALIRYSCTETCTVKEEQLEEKLDLSACNKGFLDMCIVMNSETNKRDELMKMARRYCDSKNAYSCYHVGLELQEKDQVESMKFKLKACELGLKMACLHIKELERIKKIGQGKYVSLSN